MENASAPPAKIDDDVTRHGTGCRADDHETERELRWEPADGRDDESEQRHDGELREDAEQHALRVFERAFQIAGLQHHTESKHRRGKEPQKRIRKDEKRRWMEVGDDSAHQRQRRQLLREEAEQLHGPTDDSTAAGDWKPAGAQWARVE